MRFFLISLTLISMTVCAYAKTAENRDSLPERAPAAHDFYDLTVVTRVIDGDTFKAGEERIRLWGINAPEKKSDYYDMSRLALDAFLSNGPVYCKFLTKDRYGRSVMHCYVNQSDVGSLMVRSGFAKDYSSYSGHFYSAEENFARQGQLGLWAP